MAQTSLAGYVYYSTQSEALKNAKSKDDAIDYESGLGWYIYSKSEYANNPRKRLFGF